MTLPPLPELIYSYTPDEMRAYGEACAAAEREACAKACEEMGALQALDGEERATAAMVRVVDRQADLCAAAIRARSGA